VDSRRMLGAWRWVVLGSALAGAVLTPSTDPVTMLLLAAAITALFLVGVALVALSERLRPPRQEPVAPRSPGGLAPDAPESADLR